MTTAVRVRGLTKRYGDVQAVGGIDLDISAGEVFAILGPNGAGKSTTVEIMEGYRTRDGGEVSVLGTDPNRPTREWRSRIGVVLQTTNDVAEATVRVIVLTTYETDQDIVRAVEAGAAGYLLKDTSRADLLGAVVSAARGETVLSPSVATRLVTRMRAPVTESLSPREVEVLTLVAEGLTNAKVGKALFVSETTVKTHLLRVFGKLGVSDRTAAVITALGRGLLTR
ncbi:LuxR C-terminal-related transcriptional regulator [Streptosporangium sp. NPDC000396]|uniref:LuxR C-terminal-related transcriptional regulator n=1 Tax=Streptosporangium sp. NPDC000396 TaxID=3366185 RepID=UPI0036C0F23C